MLERQIMFKKLQELQRKKKLQELNDSRPQNVMESLMHNKQSSGGLHGLMNTGIPVRDPSQMFIFGDTKFAQGFSNRLVYSQTQTHVLPSSITVTNNMALISSSSIYSQHLDMANQNMIVLKSKKRKFPTFEHLPWHKEVTGGCSRFHDMSTAELDWTRSANRLPEKLKEDKVHWKRRLSLTTQLMQLVFLPPPAIILSGDATARCDTVAYYAAKLALGDACSLASRSYRHQDIPGLPSGKCIPSKSSNDQRLSKTVEGFIDRSNSLEEELSRLEKGESSILNLKVEFQDLEKFSVISRFAVFHSRGSPDTASSGGALAMPKMYPQRYAKAKAMPSTVPEGHHCLSL